MTEEPAIPDAFAVVGPADGERAQALAMAIMRVIKAHYEKGPIGPERVFESLNALAVCAAMTIGGAGSREIGEAFKISLNTNLDLIYKAQEQHEKAD